MAADDNKTNQIILKSHLAKLGHQFSIVDNGEEALEPYQFDYLLLCAKICGASHYNMQMKIVVESEKDYKKYLKK